jgi:lysophospholipase L1-like esterase
VRIKRFISSAPVALLFFLNQHFSQAAEPFALKPNDTVVFYGDSITDQRLYTMLTEFYVVTRYPKLNVNFVHSGWGGDKVSGGGGGPVDVRLARDVVAYHPTVLTIMLGMNDGGYTNHKEANDTAYFDGYRHIVESVEKSVPGVRITAIGPSPYDDVTRPINLQPDGYNAVLVHYCEFLKKYAADDKFSYADLNSGVVAMLQKANATDPAVAQKIIPDRIHPGLAGHLIMAEQLLKSWNARPIVSAVSIDAATGKVNDTQFANVTDLHTGAPLTWTQTDEALPLPLADLIATDKDKTVDLAVHSSDIADALDEQLMRVTGLAPGQYQVIIDKDAVGAFSEAQLAKGINLATLQTPMSKQAMTVRDLTVTRLVVHNARWREFQVPLGQMDLLHLEDALKSLDTLDTELTTRQRQAALPLPHVFQVVAVQ